MNAQRKTDALRASLYVSLGVNIPFDDVWTLRRAELTLHRWAEEECNGTVQRDDADGKPYRWIGGMGYGAPIRSVRPIPDRETGALKRVAEVCARYGLVFYHQTDPRGCALYVARADAGMTDSNYSSVGVAVTA